MWDVVQGMDEQDTLPLEQCGNHLKIYEVAIEEM